MTQLTDQVQPAKRRSPRDAAVADRRSCKKLVRYSSSELQRVNERARACGRPVACFIREISVGSRTRGVRSPLNDQLVANLARVGTRLRELATNAAEHQLPGAADYSSALDGLLSLIDQIC